VTEDNRIHEIRAVLDEVSREKTGDGFYFAAHLARVKVILDSAPPAPRVFFPGETVPAGTYLLNDGGGVLMPRDEPRDVIGARVYVELHVLSPEEWQATVDRARAEREANRDV
jgi:hypothetical protein